MIAELRQANAELRQANAELRDVNRDIYAINDDLRQANAELRRVNAEIREGNADLRKLCAAHAKQIESLCAENEALRKQLAVRCEPPTVAEVAEDDEDLMIETSGGSKTRSCGRPPNELWKDVYTEIPGENLSNDRRNRRCKFCNKCVTRMEQARRHMYACARVPMAIKLKHAAS